MESKSISLELKGMAGFVVIWTGQLLSVMGSTMTQFALTVWIYQKTGSALMLSTIQTVYMVPFMIFTPIAGVLIDKYNRKLMMMMSDLFAVTATIGIFILSLLGILKTWHIFVAAVINGIGNCFQWPAFSAAISMMLPKEKLGRANAMMYLVDSIPGVFAPIAAGILLPHLMLKGILGIDVASFVFALIALAIVKIPLQSAEEKMKAESFISQMMFGFRYIYGKKGLLTLLLYFISLNFTIGLAFPLLPAFILSRTGNNSQILGFVQSASAFGAVAGGIIASLWLGFKKRIKTIIIGEALSGLLLLIFGFANQLPLWMIAAGVGAVFPVLTNSASQAIWQSKVPPSLQGRVFSSRRLIAMIVSPLAFMLAGFFADFLSEPFMRKGIGLASVFGMLVGNKEGSGMALHFILSGFIYMALTIYAAFLPRLKNLETEIPDHDENE